MLAACLGALLMSTLTHVAPAPADAVTAGPDGNVWFTEPGVNAIGRITPGGVVSQFSIPTPDSQPDSITVGPDGALWFSEQGAHKVGSITPGGVITELPVPSPSSGITAGVEGTLWIAERRLGPSRIARLGPTGVVRQFPIARVDSKPSALAAGPEGDIWLIDDPLGFGPSIARITPSGIVTRFLLPPLQSASDLARGPDGAMWFTVAGASTSEAAIGRISATGSINEFPVPGNFDLLGGIAPGPDGDMWFTDSLNDEIRRMTPTGAVSEWPVRRRPTDIAAGPDGNLWFTGSPEKKIGRITPQGAISEFPIPPLIRCIVPNLRGRTLPQAVRTLHRDHCRLGRISMAARARALPRVIGQQPLATAVYPRAKRVNLRLR